MDENKDIINEDSKESKENLEEIPSSTIFESDEMSIAQTTPQIPNNNMEVHHHPDLHHKKKKWKDLLLEFFMIFLAVAMGFFSENLREEYVNNHREHKYMQALARDLDADSLLLSNNIETNLSLAKADSLFLYKLSYPMSNSIDSIFTLYELSSQFNAGLGFNRTFDALKSTGDLRLIKNEKVLNSISSYYASKDNIITFRDEIQAHLQLTYGLSHKIFDKANYERKLSNLTLINPDKELMFEYRNKVYLLIEMLQSYSFSLKSLLKESLQVKKEIISSYD